MRQRIAGERNGDVLRPESEDSADADDHRLNHAVVVHEKVFDLADRLAI
jgi:hypothetical protein